MIVVVIWISSARTRASCPRSSSDEPLIDDSSQITTVSRNGCHITSAAAGHNPPRLIPLGGGVDVSAGSKSAFAHRNKTTLQRRRMPLMASAGSHPSATRRQCPAGRTGRLPSNLLRPNRPAGWRLHHPAGGCLSTWLWRRPPRTPHPRRRFLTCRLPARAGTGPADLAPLTLSCDQVTSPSATSVAAAGSAMTRPSRVSRKSDTSTPSTCRVKTTDSWSTSYRRGLGTTPITT